MKVEEAIRAADALLPGRPTPDDKEDPRWQAIIRVADFIDTSPDCVWAFADRWGRHEDSDLQAAIATCVLEHLLEHHFKLVFPRVQQSVRDSRHFANTFSMCWKFGASLEAENSSRFDALQQEACG